MTDQEPHYSLRWNNHQAHILSAFEALLQASTLVDVSLVCAEGTIRAHKVVLSACSPFFQRIFSENPCKHPVIVLCEFSEWEIQALVDFMYKGEISVGHEQLPSLIKAADSLQIRGLAPQETTVRSQPPTPSTSPHDSERSVEVPAKLPHMAHLSFTESLSSGGELCGSPLPRRKQARPRRRSGELVPCCPQDLSNTRPAHQALPPSPVPPPVAPAVLAAEDTAEDLCVKKERPSSPSPAPRRSPPPPPPSAPSSHGLPQLSAPGLGPPPNHHPPPPQAHLQNNHLSHHPRPPLDSPEPPSPEHQQMDLSTGKEYGPSPPMQHHPQEYNLPPPPPPHPGLGLGGDQHSPMSFPPMPSVTALAMTQPHSKFFGLDSPLALFPPGLDGCRNPLLDMTDPRNTPDPQLFVKKKMGRPKGQHSAPRGGPPRSWTNAELTEALQHVWNKKMTTSQASRIFGIPYNSLLMYVRGKYGKSLKLEQLRKDCTGSPAGPLELLGLGGSNSPPGKPGSEREPAPAGEMPLPNSNHQRPPADADLLPNPLFNHFPHNFYHPEFGSSFPIPVSMIHLLPQSEKSRSEMFSHSPPDEDAKSDQSKDAADKDALDHLYNRPPPQGLASSQQNGAGPD